MVSLGYCIFSFPPGNHGRADEPENPQEPQRATARALRPDRVHGRARRRLGTECHLVSSRRTASLQRIADRYPPVSAKVLSQRLRELEARGVITRTVQPTTPPSVEYTLTPLGHELVPALSAIAEVGHKLKAWARQAREGLNAEAETKPADGHVSVNM